MRLTDQVTLMCCSKTSKPLQGCICASFSECVYYLQVRLTHHVKPTGLASDRGMSGSLLPHVAVFCHI